MPQFSRVNDAFPSTADGNSAINLEHVPAFPGRCSFTRFVGLSVSYLANLKLHRVVVSLLPLVSNLQINVPCFPRRVWKRKCTTTPATWSINITFFIVFWYVEINWKVSSEIFKYISETSSKRSNNETRKYCVPWTEYRKNKLDEKVVNLILKTMQREYC